MWCPPTELSNNIPRDVKSTAEFKVIIFFSLVILLTLTLIIARNQIIFLRDVEILKSRGVDAYATVTRAYQASHKGAISYRVEYVFTPIGALSEQPFRGQSALSESEFFTIYSGGEIRVIYDPLQPDRSLPNIGNVVRFRPHPSGMSLAFPAIVPFFFGVGFVLCLLVKFDREKRLLKWGEIAEAKILNEEEFYSKSGRWSRITYTFSDHEGFTIEDERKYVPVKDSRSNNLIILREKILNSPTILFDKHDPITNIIYPPSFVEIKRS